MQMLDSRYRFYGNCQAGILGPVLASSVSLPHFNRNIGTHFGAQGATRAGPFLPAVLYGIVSALVEGRTDFQKLLYTCCSTKLTTLAVVYVDDDLAHGHLVLSMGHGVEALSLPAPCARLYALPCSIISSACFMVASVMVLPPSMRATSSTRSFSLRSRTSVCVLSSLTDLATP
jgi:hypothetical protein